MCIHICKCILTFTKEYIDTSIPFILTWSSIALMNTKLASTIYHTQKKSKKYPRTNTANMARKTGQMIGRR